MCVLYVCVFVCVPFTRYMHVREMSGIFFFFFFFFFKVRELSGNSVMCQGKTKFCNHVREMSGNFAFQSDETRMFCPDVIFLLNS